VDSAVAGAVPGVRNLLAPAVLAAESRRSAGGAGSCGTGTTASVDVVGTGSGSRLQGVSSQRQEQRADNDERL